MRQSRKEIQKDKASNQKLNPRGDEGLGSLSSLNNQFNLSLICPRYVVAGNCHHLTGSWRMVKFYSLVYLLGKSEPIFPSYLDQTAVFSQGPLSRSDTEIQGKTTADKMQISHYIKNMFFPSESHYILLQSSYSPKNFIENVCLFDKGRPCGLPFTSLSRKFISTP